MTKVAVIVGSLRAQSHNHALARALAKLARGRLEFDFVEIGDLPLYNQDSEAELPASVRRLKQQIEVADAILFVTPEYLRSIPGVLKNALDWASRPWGQNSFPGKPGGIVGTTPGAIGTAVAQSHLRSIATVLDIPLMTQPEIYLQTRDGLFDAEDNVTDEATRALLQKWVDRFVVWVERFKAPAHAAAR